MCAAPTMDALIKYLTLCRDSLADIIQNFDLSNLKAPTYSADDSRQRLENELEKIKKELKTLITQKVKELTANPGMSEIINETYASLQTEKMERISATQKTLQDLTKEPHIHTVAIKPNLQTALDILNETLEQKNLVRTDIEVLVEKIIVDKDGNVDIYLKSGGLRFQSRQGESKADHDDRGNPASSKRRNGFYLCKIPGGKPEKYGLSYAQEEVYHLHGAFA